MKKNYLFGMALMASLAFYSCDKEAINVQDGEGVESVADGAQVIALQVEDGGDGLTTRTRPLYSAEAKEDIGKVKVMIYDGGGSCVRSKTIDDWKSSPAGEKMIELAGEEKLAPGRYTVYAVGCSEDNNQINDMPGPMQLLNNGELQLPCSINNIGSNIDEIFAGSLALTVEEGEGFKKTITMSRQVAGAYIYVKGIPYVSSEASYLKLYASARNSSLIVDYQHQDNLDVVNGTEPDEMDSKKEILSINLREWFGDIQDSDRDNLIDENNWTCPLDNYGFIATGAVLGGAFVVPFKYMDRQQTLTLVLTDEQGNVEYKKWNVNLRSEDKQLNGSLLYWNPSEQTWNEGGNMQESQTSYSLVRNHLYGVGTKSSDSDEGTPATLNTKQELVLTVNPNWNVVHGMELD